MRHVVAAVAHDQRPAGGDHVRAAGGRIVERAPDGEEHEWGTILWHLFFDPSEAKTWETITARFVAAL